MPGTVLGAGDTAVNKTKGQHSLLSHPLGSPYVVIALGITYPKLDAQLCTMCEGPRSIGWALALWEPAIYLEDISPNHPNKIKQPTQTPSHTHIHNYSLGKGCNSRLNHQGQGGQCFRNSGKALYLLVTFQMHQGLWTVSCLLDSLLPSG